jgi:O-antigen ligase
MPGLIATMHRIRMLATCLVAVYFLFPILWASYIIGLWALVSLVIGCIQFRQIRQKDLSHTLLYILPFVVLVGSVFLHGGGGEKFIERGLSFLIFPIGIFLCLHQLSPADFKKITWVFWAGCVVLVCKGLVLYGLVPPHIVYTEHHDFIFRYRREFAANTGIAPTYASLYLAFALLLVLHQWKHIHQGKVGLVIGAVFLLINLILLSAKMPMVAFGGLAMLIFIRRQWLKKNRKYKIWAGLVLLLFTSSVAILGFSRWNELLTSIYYQPTDVKENSVGIRGMIFTCAWEVATEHYLTGVGPQQVQPQLNQCYYQFEGNDFDRHTFNTHNQYLDYLIASGLAGLAVLLLVLGVPLYNALRTKDVILFSFISLVGLCMLTENLLSRQSGIVFYAFFNALLINRQRSIQPKKSGA